jgi:hypothetical protein
LLEGHEAGGRAKDRRQPIIGILAEVGKVPASQDQCGDRGNTGNKKISRNDRGGGDGPSCGKKTSTHANTPPLLIVIVVLDV